MGPLSMGDSLRQRVRWVLPQSRTNVETEAKVGSAAGSVSVKNGELKGLSLSR